MLNPISDLYAQRETLHRRERELWDVGDFYQAKIVFIARTEVQDAIDLLETGKLLDVTGRSSLAGRLVNFSFRDEPREP